jgi:hypothetical protein
MHILFLAWGEIGIVPEQKTAETRRNGNPALQFRVLEKSVGKMLFAYPCQSQAFAYNH